MYGNTRNLYDDPDAYGPKFKGIIRVIDYTVGRVESETRLEMLQRAYHRLAYNSHGGEIDFEEGTLEATFSPRDWEVFKAELGVEVNGVSYRQRDNIGTPSLRRTSATQPPRYTMEAVTGP